MPPEIRELDAGFKMLIESDMEKYRADTFWTKEPETIEWIRSFKDGEIFWDIGANIGIYSLFAAKIHAGLSVWAFEPQFLNFVRLVQNVGLNALPNILPFNLAFGRLSKITQFFVKEIEPGKSGGQIDSPIDEHGKQYQPKEVMPLVSFSIDDFIKFMSCLPPTHIKIDVDGREEGILWGMQLVLGIPALKSLLIEFNLGNSNSELLKSMVRGIGFSDDNQFNKMENHSRIRRKKENIKAENIIFIRN